MELPNDFFNTLFDSFPDHIAVVDEAGYICSVNTAWSQYGEKNNADPCKIGVGVNYLQTCYQAASKSDKHASAVAQGIADVSSGKSQFFSHEYPCHSPTLRNWFLTRCWPLRCNQQNYIVVSHQNVTEHIKYRELLRTAALTDPLTKLSNRRHFEKFLHHQWRRDMRNESPLSIVLVDLDYFKQFNDQHGHPAGDECLRLVGELLRHNINRPDDLAVRYGGEEFILVLGNTSIDDAMLIADTIRLKISELEVPINGSIVESAVTASIGVASIVPNRGSSEAWLLELVDKALYTAKNEGRNKVTVFR